ncbi:RIP homotypic interaction motif-containing protein [Longispora albida]|uniref:RIP homotypic interaction motif-containing protein n=1 Tax=Longispora albida TaxID=203523 RepID=UPI001B7F8BCA|nr:RIP homotypic interaction motif-containing protein [Longispora albida]
MDPASIVIAAITAGSVAGLKDTASAAVKDAYQSLKGLVGSRLAASSRGTAALEGVQVQPEVWRAVLGSELAAVELGDEVVRVAQRVLQLADPAGFRQGKYVVDLRDAKGVQVGDNNTMNIRF